MFEKIPTRALSDTVAQQLLAQIDKGTFARGGKLPTEAARSGVRRQPHGDLRGHFAF